MEFYINSISAEIGRILNIDSSYIKNILYRPTNNLYGDYTFPCFKVESFFKNKSLSEIADMIKSNFNIDCIETIINVGPYVNFFIDIKYIVNYIIKYKNTNRDMNNNLSIIMPVSFVGRKLDINFYYGLFICNVYRNILNINRISADISIFFTVFYDIAKVVFTMDYFKISRNDISKYDNIIDLYCKFKYMNIGNEDFKKKYKNFLYNIYNNFDSGYKYDFLKVRKVIFSYLKSEISIHNLKVDNFFDDIIEKYEIDRTVNEIFNNFNVKNFSDQIFVPLFKSPCLIKDGNINSQRVIDIAFYHQRIMQNNNIVFGCNNLQKSILKNEISILKNIDKSNICIQYMELKKILKSRDGISREYFINQLFAKYDKNKFINTNYYMFILKEYQKGYRLLKSGYNFKKDRKINNNIFFRDYKYLLVKYMDLSSSIEFSNVINYLLDCIILLKRTVDNKEKISLNNIFIDTLLIIIKNCLLLFDIEV